MRRFKIWVYRGDPRHGARACCEMFLLATSQAAASALAMQCLAEFPWKQLDVLEAPAA